MPKPVTIPNTFATATTAIPLTNLDADFTAVASTVNDANSYSNFAADTGSANAYVVTLTGVTTTYTAGLRIQFKALNANTTASTVNVNGQGAKNITFQDATALASGTIAANAIVDVMYDGTQFLLMNDPAGATGGDVVGPSSATDNAVVRFDTGTGKLVQNSVVTIADSTGDVAGVGALTMGGNLTLNGGTANGVLFLNGSKVATSGSALTFDGTNLGVGTASPVSILNASFSGGAVSGTHSMAFGYPYAANLQIKSTNAGASAAVASVGLYGNPERTREFAFFNQATDARVGYLGYQYSSGGAITDLTLLNALAGSLIFGTNNAEAMRLTSTGLGIGTSSPATKFAVNAGSSTKNNVAAVFSHAGYSSADGASTEIVLGSLSDAAGQVTATGARIKSVENYASGYGVGITLQYRTAGNTLADGLVLDSSGNLGLGTNSPASISGGYGTFTVNGSNGGGFDLQRAGTTQGNIYVDSLGLQYSAVSTNPHIWYTNGTERARISSDGTFRVKGAGTAGSCLLYTSDAADE